MMQLAFNVWYNDQGLEMAIKEWWVGMGIVDLALWFEIGNGNQIFWK